MITELSDNERCDRVNEDLVLITDKSGLSLGTDTLLLSYFIKGKPNLRALELGAGTGILSMLVAARKKAGAITAVEIQEKYASLAARNVEYNRLSERITVICGDVRDLSTAGIPREKFDIVFSNPPYMPLSCGARNATDDNFIARHEVHGEFKDFAHAAAYALRYGGRFFCVHRPDRLTDLLFALRCEKLEPKRLTFIQPSAEEAPSLVLIEAAAGGKPGVAVTAPILLYTDRTHTHETEVIKSALHNGNFTENTSCQT